jgi:hypothetical protein
MGTGSSTDSECNPREAGIETGKRRKEMFRTSGQDPRPKPCGAGGITRSWVFPRAGTGVGDGCGVHHGRPRDGTPIDRHGVHRATRRVTPHWERRPAADAGRGRRTLPSPTVEQLPLSSAAGRGPALRAQARIGRDCHPCRPQAGTPCARPGTRPLARIASDYATRMERRPAADAGRGGRTPRSPTVEPLPLSSAAWRGPALRALARIGRDCHPCRPQAGTPCARPGTRPLPRIAIDHATRMERRPAADA